MRDAATDRRTGSGNLDMLTSGSDCFFDLTRMPQRHAKRLPRTLQYTKNARVPSETKHGTLCCLQHVAVYTLDTHVVGTAADLWHGKPTER